MTDSPLTIRADPTVAAMLCLQRQVDETRVTNADRIAIVQGLWNRLDDLMDAIPAEFTCGTFGSHVADLKEQAAATVLTSEQYANLDWDRFWDTTVAVTGEPTD